MKVKLSPCLACVATMALAVLTTIATDYDCYHNFTNDCLTGPVDVKN